MKVFVKRSSIIVGKSEGSVFTNICVGESSTDPEDDCTLTTTIASEAEIDYWIDSLVSDLEKTRKSAKKILNAHRQEN